MPTESKTIVLQIDADPRFAAAAGGAARCFADSAGLEEEATAQLQAAVVATCKEAFESLGDAGGHLSVSFTRHSDRIEVAVSRTGAAGKQGGKTALGGVDEVHYETQNGVSITRLTKYIGQWTPSR